MAAFEAWLGTATGKRQHEPGGPTALERWTVTLDDGRQMQIDWWDVQPTLQGVPGPTITSEIWVGGEQCLLQLPRDEFDRLREQLGVWWACDELMGVPPEVEEQAQLGLRMYRSQVGPGAILPGATGSAEEAGRITLEQGYRLHHIDADRLRNAFGQSLLALAYPAPAWLYAVNGDGVSRRSIIVGLEGGRYTIVGWGGLTENYSVALGNMRRLMPQDAPGEEPTLIQAGPDYYFAVRAGDQELVLPVVSPDMARRGWAGGMDYSRLWAAADVVRYLQERQRQQAVPGQRGGEIDG